ncbi:MAG: VRR-NUC domain-containing protein [Pseudomonadales bacterium]|nr:VRR-NUC domain-containing protein [Pseudomonadales bacterium]
MAEDLPIGYYLKNFNFLLDFVFQYYDDVLLADELAYRVNFQKLSVAAQRLYVRLSSRRGPMFRVEKIHYAEIIDVEAGINELVEQGYFDQSQEVAADWLLSLMTKNELLELFDLSGQQMRREELDQAIIEQHSAAQIKSLLEIDTVMPLGEEHLKIYKLLFFGNLSQDFTEFVLRDLGLSRFENYLTDRSARYFDDRPSLEKVLHCGVLNEACQHLIAVGDAQQIADFGQVQLTTEKFLSADLLADAILHKELHKELHQELHKELHKELHLEVSDAEIIRRYSKMFNSLARQLERLDSTTQALRLYEQSTLPPARERRARLLAKCGDVQSSLALCAEIVALPATEAELAFAIQFGNRLIARHKCVVSWLPVVLAENFQHDEISLHKVNDVNVEILVCEWFKQQGSDAYYVENGLIPSLFGLYFWDIIFIPIKGVFFNPVQRGPIDLFTADFKVRRQALIEDRLLRMTEENYTANKILSTYRQKLGIANYLVSWNLIDIQLLKQSLSRIGVNDLKQMFIHLLQDLRHNRSGLPDLVVFPPQAGYQLVEVKAPGDRLQNSQKCWFKFFTGQQIPASIVNVRWQ